MKIETDNLWVIRCDQNILKAAIQGNGVLEETLNVNSPENWTEFGIPALQYSLDKLVDAREAGWWTYFPVFKESSTLIGSGGYKGKPLQDGVVEIGYEIATEFRKRGLATEFAKALVKNAFSHEEVQAVIAHTLGEDNASTRVLSKCGFKKIAEYNDPDDGLLWRWEKKRTTK